MKKERNLLKLMTDKECAVAYKQSLINSEKHKETAIAIANAGQYGMAVSHLILGTEEMVKTLLLHVQSRGLDVRNVPSVYLFFTDHIIKHNFVVLLTTMYSFLKPFMSLIYKMRDEIHSPEIKQEYTVVEQAMLSQNKRQILVAFRNIPEMFKWWDEANIMKNKGFYVDYTTSLETPMQVSEDEYLQALKFTNEVRNQIIEIIKYLEKLSEEDIKETLVNAKQYNYTSLLTW